MKTPFQKNCADEYPSPRPFPKFCERCGSPLMAVCEQTGFDETTGNPKFTRWKRCPRSSGDRRKLVSASYFQWAASLVETFDARLNSYGSPFDVDYIDCHPAYMPVKTTAC